MPVLHYGKRGIFGIQAGIKRIFDVLGSLLALIMLSPILAIVALCIKIEDHGPVIYRQTRCTLGGREFSIYKFRSMVTDAEKHTGAMLAAKKDARLTKVGRIIRNTKLDELPQLVNILKGDMSFVGPRPERPELIAQALKVVPEFVLRTKVKAGLTGYAQIKGNYNTSFLQKLKWDMIYIENYSLWLDFKVIVLTIPSILQGDNSEDHSKWEEGE